MGNKVESKPEADTQLPLESKASIITQHKAEKPLKVPQSKSQTQLLQKQNELKMDSRKFGLVFYEISKQDDSIFTDEQKFKVRVSFVGVFVSLATATLINMSTMIGQPSQKYKKWIVTAGTVNLFGSMILGGYGLYHVIDLSTKISEAQWAKIQAEKEEYDKLTFSQKRQLFNKKLEEKEVKRKSEELLAKQKELSQKQHKQEKTDLVK